MINDTGKEDYIDVNNFENNSNSEHPADNHNAEIADNNHESSDRNREFNDDEDEDDVNGSFNDIVSKEHN